MLIAIKYILSQANHYMEETEKFKKECTKLWAQLDKERKDAQGKSDL